MSQKEVTHPGALAIMAVQQAQRGGTYTATRIEGFEEGWAQIAFMKAHYFQREGDAIWTACGKGWTMNERAGLWKPHPNTPRCKTCERRAPKQPLPVSGVQEPKA